MISSIKDTLLDLLFPLTCLVCHREGGLLCDGCEPALTRLEPPFCEVCADPGSSPFCSWCAAKRPPIDVVRDPLYDGRAAEGDGLRPQVQRRSGSGAGHGPAARRLPWLASPAGRCPRTRAAPSSQGARSRAQPVGASWPAKWRSCQGCPMIGGFFAGPRTRVRRSRLRRSASAGATSRGSSSASPRSVVDVCSSSTTWRRREPPCRHAPGP